MYSAGRAAVVVGWIGVLLSLATQSDNLVYAAYIAILVLLVYRARSMQIEEGGYRDVLGA